jgi:hypothetical protein
VDERGGGGAGTGAGARIIAGTYTGLRWIDDANGQFSEGDKLNDLYESLPVIAVDTKGTVWASHPYRGVYKNPLPGKDGKPVHYKNYGPKE